MNLQRIASFLCSLIESTGVFNGTGVRFVLLLKNPDGQTACANNFCCSAHAHEAALEHVHAAEAASGNSETLN